MVDLPMPDTEPFIGETLRADGWVYRDTPPMLEEFWKRLCDVMGTENYRLMTYAERKFKGDDRLYVRGQMFVSPAGIENLKTAFAKTTDSDNLS